MFIRSKKYILLMLVMCSVSQLSRGAVAGPLHTAATNGDIAKVKSLIEEGADVDAKGSWDKTPLHNAAYSGHKAVVELLIANSADVNAKDRNGRPPLHYAVLKGHKEVTELLIASGAGVNAKTTTGKTPLHDVAYQSHKDLAVVEFIIAKGADVNAKDNNGMIPLHDAVAHGYRELVELLIAKGADVHAKDKWNRTPLYYAVSKGHKEIAELLNAHCQPSEELDGLRIGISQVKRPEQNNYDKPRFHVTLQNAGKKDLVLNLGMMLANGKEQYSTAVKLIFTDPNGKTYEFRNNIGRHPGIAGRVDPFLVPLAFGCTYVLRVDFDNYWSISSTGVPVSLPKGQYLVAAIFDGKAINFKDTGLYTRDLYWTGVIKSKEVLFKNLYGGPPFPKPDFVVSEEPEEQQLLRNHTKWISECIKRTQSIKPGATRAELLEVFRTEGGISTRSWRRYVYKGCPYIKVDVEFKAVDDDKWNEKPGDIITKISKPFLEWSIMD